MQIVKMNKHSDLSRFLYRKCNKMLYSDKHKYCHSESLLEESYSSYSPKYYT